MQLKDRVDVETLANIIKAIPSVIFFKDRDLKYLFSTHYWEQVNQDKKDNENPDEEFDIYGKTDRDIRKDTENLEKQEASDRRILETGVGVAYSIKSEVDGNLKHLELLKEPVRDKDGNIIGVVGLINDVTHVTTELENALREAERMAGMKSDFLANMSHEIRTPMNAVIGMAELALREELPPAAREYITQIKSSGNALLNIINDILDFSKIDAGKFDIIEDEYEPLSAMHDLSSILMTKLVDSKVEIIGTINPDTPSILYGDVMRIRQIVLNLANNAVKFTKEGSVSIHIDYEKTGEDEIEMTVSVADTGIGIKEEDIPKLFDAFQQVDSRRTRNVEGTGLGLAICNRLLELMNGTISVESEYGKGSVFTIRLPQKVISWDPVIKVKNPESKLVVGYWKHIRDEGFFKTLDELGVESFRLDSFDNFEKYLSDNAKELKNKDIYLFTSQEIFDSDIREYIRDFPEIEFVVNCEFSSKPENIAPNVRYLKKPYSTQGISTMLNNESIHAQDEAAFELDFVAPNAKILLVDDNEVNLLVAEGLLEPLKMQVKTAASGKKAIEMIEQEPFDIVFMDHMMPELDGVETTKRIRENHPELKDMPIIALSANALAEARNLFLSSGMNDFVAKPIEVRTITSKIKQWLPNELVTRDFEMAAKKKKSKDFSDSIYNLSEGRIDSDILDVESALNMIGNENLYMTILEKYYESISSKAALIEKCEKTEDIAAYTIEVHALKSASRQIGAMNLSAMAADLEACGHANDIETIHKNTRALLDKYLVYLYYLEPLFKKEEETADKRAVSSEQLNWFFGLLLEAADNLDMDVIEETIGNMKEYAYSGNGETYFEELKEAASNYDMDKVVDIIGYWKVEL